MLTISMRTLFLSFLNFFLLIQFGSSQTLSQNKPLSEQLKNTSRSTNLTQYLNEQDWNNLFPNRYGKRNNGPAKKTDFYSFQFLVKAAKLFPLFLNEGDADFQKKELAAFLANVAQETSGGWASAPGGYLKWGLYYLEEQNKSFNYSDSTKKNYPPVKGRSYFGRGPFQLSWNYNYGQFSEAWFGNKDSLLLHPELISQDPVLSFASAIWFWMTPQFPKPSCHDVIIGKWRPTAEDSAKGRLSGFGTVVNIINGGIECGNARVHDKTNYRYQYYKYFCDYFHVDPGDNIDCNNAKPFGQ